MNETQRKEACDCNVFHNGFLDFQDRNEINLRQTSTVCTALIFRLRGQA